MRWQRRRNDLLLRRNYTCCECNRPLTAGTMDLEVHHVLYIPGLAPWDYPDELLLVVCRWHHRERAAIEQAIYVQVGQHLATRDIPELQRQPVYAFFENDPLLAHLPSWMQDALSYPPNHPERVTIGCEKTACPLRAKIQQRLIALGIEPNRSTYRHHQCAAARGSARSAAQRSSQCYEVGLASQGLCRCADSMKPRVTCHRLPLS